MKSLLVLLVLVSSINVWSAEETETNQVCKTVYRSATTDLIATLKAFKDEKISPKELAFFAKAGQAEAMIAETYCSFAASDDAKECMNGYKTIYQRVQSNINAGALFTGNQKDVDVSSIYLWTQEKAVQIHDIKCN